MFLMCHGKEYTLFFLHGVVHDYEKELLYV
jgi:hypothetical protein